MDKFANEIEFQPETNTTSTVFNHNYLIIAACQYGYKKCVESAKMEFDKVKAGNYSYVFHYVNSIYPKNFHNNFFLK